MEVLSMAASQLSRKSIWLVIDLLHEKATRNKYLRTYSVCADFEGHEMVLRSTRSSANKYVSLCPSRHVLPSKFSRELLQTLKMGCSTLNFHYTITHSSEACVLGRIKEFLHEALPKGEDARTGAATWRKAFLPLLGCEQRAVLLDILLVNLL